MKVRVEITPEESEIGGANTKTSLDSHEYEILIQLLEHLRNFETKSGSTQIFAINFTRQFNI